MNHLANTEPDIVKAFVKLIPEYGRYDDLMCLLGTECEVYHSKARRRTNNRGFYGSTVNWKHRDAQKVLSMDSQEEEFNDEKR